MSFLRFLWDFFVGDDPLVAAAVVVAIAVTAVFEVWWLLPLAVAGVLYLSLRHAARSGDLQLVPDDGHQDAAEGEHEGPPKR